MDKILKTFKDSTGREYRVVSVHGFGGAIAIDSKQANGRFKQLNANKGKGLRLLKKYAKECLR
ncbi:MAG: hypothetical protein RBQ91_05920 [Acholeplasma sp.]|nr:hypothetical protein [Acholeplasma sp.]